MKFYRNFVSVSLNVRVGNQHLRQLVLHRHKLDITQLQTHSHSHLQTLCYFHGQGKFRVAQQTYTVQQGHILLIPKNIEHSFVRTAKAAPTCLVLDWDWKEFQGKEAILCLANHRTLHRIKQLLAEVSRLSERENKSEPLDLAAKVLEIQSSFLQALQLTPTRSESIRSPLVQKVQRILNTNSDGSFSDCKTVSKQMGYQVDYLNRVFRRETGSTLGQFLSEQKLTVARKHLKTQLRVAEAGRLCGFTDANYFSRWFKKWTGISPKTFQATCHHK